jgi:hypothetical protein
VTAVAVEAVRGRSRPVTALLPAFALVAALTAWVTWRSWGRGQLLYRDFVAVPDPVLGPAALGTDGQPPRAVPLDAVVALLDPLLPSGLQQQLMLAGCVFLAGAGVAVLLRHRGQVAMVTGAVVAAWNPYVAERLLVGQPPTLLAYSMTPWLVAAVRSRLRPAYRLLAVAAAAAPAALTPWGGVLAAVVVLGAATLLVPRPTWGLVGAYAVLAVLWCLPWAVPTLRYGSGTGDADGAAAFALGADSWAGTVGSALTLGGIWAPAARLGSREGVLAVVCAFVLLGVAVVGAVVLRREGRTRELAALVTAWAVPTALALLLAWGPVLRLYAALQAVPGFALVRDTHRLLALPAMAVAVLVGVGAGSLAAVVDARLSGAVPGQRASSGPGARTSAASVGAAAFSVLAVSLTLLTAPDLPRRVGEAYRPVAYPAEWGAMVRAVAPVDGDNRVGPGQTRVLSLPWQPFRQVAWAGAQPFLDPLPRAVRAEVVGSTVLTVPRDGALLPVGTDPPEATAWAQGRLDVAALSRSGIGYVVEWKTSPGRLPARHDGLRLVTRGQWFDIWAVPGAARRVAGNTDGSPTSG